MQNVVEQKQRQRIGIGYDFGTRNDGFHIVESTWKSGGDRQES